MFKFVVFIVLSFFGIISFNNISKSAKFDDVNSIDIEKKLNDNLCSNDNDLCVEPYYAYFDFDTGMLSSDNIIECSIIDNCESIPHISYDGNIIVEVLSQEINESKLKLTLPDFDACSSVILTYNNWIKTINIYSSSGNDKYAISSYTPNKARRLIESQSEESLSYREESIYIETPDFDAEEEINIGHNNRNGDVYGYLKWSDDDSNDHPLQGVKVKLIYKNILGIAFAQYYTYSNNYGYYQLNIVNNIANYSFELHVIFENEMVSVTNHSNQVHDIRIDDNNNTIINNQSNNMQIYDFDNTHNDYFYRFAQVFCAMYNFSNYAKELNNNVNIPMCKIIYPTYTDPENSDNNDNGSYYVNGGNTIHLGYDKQQEPGSPNVYASWDVIGHEYGHHLQHLFFSTNYHGRHIINWPLIRSYFDNNNITLPTSSQIEEAKIWGAGLSLKEAWATFFSISAQSTFSADLRLIDTVGDGSYTAYNRVDYRLDQIKNDWLNGETCEAVISYFLYAIWDVDNNESWDNITISDDYLWYLMCQNNPDTFYEFYEKLYYDPLINVNKNDLNKILEKMHISSYNLSINQPNNYAIQPTFTWDSGNVDVILNNNSYPYANNKFSFCVYDINNNLLFERNNILTNSYTLSESEWNQVLNTSSNKYKVMVKAYSTLGFETGPYMTSLHEFNKPQQANYSISLNNQNYYEKQAYIQAGTYWDITISVTNSGNYLLQTFGNLDTKMDLYSSDGITLITPSDDEGYDNNSLIYTYLNTNTTYHLIVSFYNPSTSGLTKLAITPTISYTETGITTIDEYEDILNIYTGSNINMNFNLTQYNSIVLTWTPFTSGNYTIRLDSIFDNFLYIINPTSTNYLRLDIDYNDDEYYYDDEDFERNAYLSNYYYSNITYFIIITQFDVSNNTGNNNTINLTIT